MKTPLRVALYSAIVVERDAISRSFLNKFEFLQTLKERGEPVEVTGFTHHTDFRDPNIVAVDDLSQLLRHPFHLTADIHIYECSMPYDLFNSIFLVSAPSLVIDHNTTPPELIADPLTRELCARSRKERYNLEQATHIACDSEFTARELTELGLNPDHVSVLHLPPAHGIASPKRKSIRNRNCDAPVSLAYIGRLVAAKGIPDLIAADALLRGQGIDGYTITAAGSSLFADDDIVEQLSHLADTYPETFQLVLDADDEEVDRLLANCDALVMPSRHEGYCVPIVEALSAGCYVIGANAGNIPYVMAGLGSLYPSGQAEVLADQMSDFINRVRTARATDSPLVLGTSLGTLPLETWASQVETHLKAYGHRSYYAKLIELLRDLGSLRRTDLAWMTPYIAELASEHATVLDQAASS